jgi:hypothetical protein
MEDNSWKDRPNSNAEEKGLREDIPECLGREYWLRHERVFDSGKDKALLCRRMSGTQIECF